MLVSTIQQKVQLILMEVGGSVGHGIGNHFHANPYPEADQGIF